MGVVMSTSHHEPMGRNKPEWDLMGKGPWSFTANTKELEDFWRYGVERSKGKDTMFTMGMRGNGDLKLEGADAGVSVSMREATFREGTNSTDVHSFVLVLTEQEF